MKWLNEAGLATGMLRLRTDAEPAIRSVAAVLMQRRRPGDTILEVTPVASSSSLGAAERWAQELAGLVRTLILDAERRWGARIRANSPLFAWAVRHAAFLYNRFQVRSTGTTPFEQVHHRMYCSKLLPFGAPVMLRSPIATEQPKLEARWQPGVWLGRRAESDENTVGAPVGVLDWSLVPDHGCP